MDLVISFSCLIALAQTSSSPENTLLENSVFLYELEVSCGVLVPSSLGEFG